MNVVVIIVVIVALKPRTPGALKINVNHRPSVDRQKARRPTKKIAKREGSKIEKDRKCTQTNTFCCCYPQSHKSELLSLSVVLIMMKVTFSIALLLNLLALTTTNAFVVTTTNPTSSSYSSLVRSSTSPSSLHAKKKVFIDGEAGTTGLQVYGRLESRDDLEIISPPSELRKDEATRKQFINEADAVILCK
jgi:hypothetical protein